MTIQRKVIRSNEFYQIDFATVSITAFELSAIPA